MPRGKALTVQRTIYLTPEMWLYLEQLAQQRGRTCEENDLIREAIRSYLDHHADVVGSRRYFQKSFQERLSLLEQALLVDSAQQAQVILFYLHILIHLVAFGIAQLVSLISRKEITAQQLIERAVIRARKDEAVFSQQVQSVREMAVPEQP